jgi:uracil-DNA glycosylase family 4
VSDSAVNDSAWQTLSIDIRRCVACAELVAGRSTVVVGTRPATSTAVLLVGEAPGAAEDERGEPFVGKAGRLLDELLDEVGLSRQAVAVANVVKCRPPNNRKPARLEVANCRGWLSAQIRLIDPRVICALGGTAAEWFFGAGARIGQLRGRAHGVDGRQLVATYHPSAAIRFGPAGMPRAALRADLALVASLSRAPL